MIRALLFPALMMCCLVSEVRAAPANDAIPNSALDKPVDHGEYAKRAETQDVKCLTDMSGNYFCRGETEQDRIIYFEAKDGLEDMAVCSKDATLAPSDACKFARIPRPARRDADMKDGDPWGFKKNKSQ